MTWHPSWPLITCCNYNLSGWLLNHEDHDLHNAPVQPICLSLDNTCTERFCSKADGCQDLDQTRIPYTLVQASEKLHISYEDVLRSYVELVIGIGNK